VANLVETKERVKEGRPGSEQPLRQHSQSLKRARIGPLGASVPPAHGLLLASRPPPLPLPEDYGEGDLLAVAGAQPAISSWRPRQACGKEGVVWCGAAAAIREEDTKGDATSLTVGGWPSGGCHPAPAATLLVPPPPLPPLSVLTAPARTRVTPIEEQPLRAVLPSEPPSSRSSEASSPRRLVEGRRLDREVSLPRRPAEGRRVDGEMPSPVRVAERVRGVAAGGIATAPLLPQSVCAQPVEGASVVELRPVLVGGIQEEQLGREAQSPVISKTSAFSTELRSLPSPQATVEGTCAAELRQVCGVHVHQRQLEREAPSVSRDTEGTCTAELGPVVEGLVHRHQPHGGSLRSNNGSRASLLGLELEDFKPFRRKIVSLEGTGPTCILGANACGKTSILEAIRFVLLRPVERGAKGFVRLGDPPCTTASVTAHFQHEAIGRLSLRRAMSICGDRLKDRFFVGSAKGSDPGPPMTLQEVSQEHYTEWISGSICWPEDDLCLTQFGLLESNSAEQLLARLPATLEQIEGVCDTTEAPLLKRRSRLKSSGSHGCGLLNMRATRVAWLGRRLDEVYRELTREPLDEDMKEWGDGGQACLRRLEDGTFTLSVSQRRGAAACGYGTALKNLSDGDRDICALALLLTLPGLLGCRDVLPFFVALDEPDSRLDKQHARALWRLLAGQQGPKQSLLTSLNNHSAYDHQGVLVLRQDAAEEVSSDLR